MNGQVKFYDYQQMQRSPQNSISVSSEEGAGTGFWDPTLSPTIATPYTTPPSSGLIAPKQSEFTSSLRFDPPVLVSFRKGSSVFKLKYSRIDVCKDASGGLKCLELSGPDGHEGSFIHAFPNSKLPIPHLERPFISSEPSSFRVSFLEEQTVQTAGTLFQTKPDYTFERWEDCIRLQEALLSQSVVLCAGIAEAKSKGRGEECISQNLRVLRARSGRQIIIVYANCQRNAKKRYMSVSLDSIDQYDPGKKASKPITLKLRADNDLLASLKTLTIQFLDDDDHMRFCSILQQGCGPLSR